VSVAAVGITKCCNNGMIYVSVGILSRFLTCSRVRYDEQQKVRLGKEAKAIRILAIDPSDTSRISKAKFARGPSQAHIDASRCPLSTDASDQSPILYRFGSFRLFFDACQYLY
jgi:hypothetical protein